MFAIACPAESNASAATVTVSWKKAAGGAVTNRTPAAFEPVPTYTVGICAGARVSTPGAAVTGVGPPRNTVSPAALIMARVRLNVSEVPATGTSRFTTMLSALAGKLTVVSRAT